MQKSKQDPDLDAKQSEKSYPDSTKIILDPLQNTVHYCAETS